PFITTLPKNLKGNDVVNYYADYLNVFGNDSCFMPFYWSRIHANGDLIYCPGHPDIIVGNVFRDGFETAFNSPESIRFRQHILTNRLPICNRCCGLYMTHSGRAAEQQSRQRLGLPLTVTTHYPESAGS
ncbi:MAG TPA: SPASM domain-containing protein, partial [Planctomycetaceae bacterium]|nr:SPASM domain-containing protein [Planctomycetaceae bacterium]